MSRAILYMGAPLMGAPRFQRRWRAGLALPAARGADYAAPMSDPLFASAPGPSFAGRAPTQWAELSRAGRCLLRSVVVLGLLSTAASGQRLTLHAHDGVVTAVAFSPDGRYLATGCEDSSIKLWSTATRHVAYSVPD